MKPKPSFLCRVMLAIGIGTATTISSSASVVTFSDTWHGVSAANYFDGSYDINAYGSATAHISLPMTNVDITQFDKRTPFSVGIGNIGSNPSIYSGSLGQDKDYFPGKRNVSFSGGLTVHWTATTIDVTLLINQDVLSEEVNYADNSDQNPADNTGPIGGAYELILQLGNFSYDSQNVFVTGHNTESLYFPQSEDFNITGYYPLAIETGWIHGAADFTPPNLTILSPAGDMARVYGGAASVQLKGIASDNTDVASVNIFVNGATNHLIAIDQSSDLPTNRLAWTAAFDLSTNNDARVGSNLVTIIASDTSGNVTSRLRSILWIETNAAAVAVNPIGAGGVRGLRAGAVLQKNFDYPVTAIAANANWLFAGWADGGGNPLSYATSFNYTDTDGALTANFVPNPFNLGLAGVYVGLFSNTNSVETTNSGYISVKISPSGTYSGQLTLAEKALPFSGHLTLVSAAGPASNECFVKLPNGQKLAVSLQINADTNLTDTGAATLSGSVTALAGARSSNSLWSSPILGQLTAPVTNISPLLGSLIAGTYNVVIAPVTSDQFVAGPAGFSYATAVVREDGHVTWVAHLADGTSPPVSFSTYVTLNGGCPFYASLYGGKGMILGSVSLAFGNPRWALGAFNWMKPPSHDKFYPQGFANSVDANVALYEPPKSGTNIFRWTYGAFELGWLGQDANIGVMFDPVDNTLSPTGVAGNELSLIFHPAAGLVSGTFRPSQNSQSISFHALTAGQAAYGYFVTTNYETVPVTVGLAALPPIFH